MDTRDLRYFLELEQSRSVQVAANALYISPQGLRKSIRRIEHEIGCQLFDPQSASLRLTRSGEAFAKYAQKVNEETLLLQANLERISTDEDGTVRIVMTPHAHELLRKGAFNEYRHIHPGSDLIVEELVDDLCEDRLKDPKYSFGILQSPYNRQLYDVTEIFSENFYVWMRTDSPFAKYDRLRLADLDGQRICLLDSSHKGNSLFRDACLEAGVSPIIDKETSDTIWIVKHVRKHGGLGLTLRFYPDEDGLTKRPIEEFSWSIGACRPRKRMLSPNAQDLLDILRKS